MKKRIYLVVHDLDTHLVEAGSKAAAVNHIARGSIKATVASQLELVELIGAGAKVQKAGNENEDVPVSA